MRLENGVQLKKIGYGNTAVIYDYGDNKILKVYNKEMPEFLCKREFATMVRIYHKSRICPKPYKLVRYEGQLGIVMEKIEGIDYLRLIIKKPWRCKRIFRYLANLQASTHVDVNYRLPRVNQRMEEMIMEVEEEILASEIKKAIIEIIRAFPDENKLCHGDYHPGNVLLSGERVVIIDWMTAMCGNKLYDISKTIMMIRYNDIYIKSKILIFFGEKLRKYMSDIYLKEYLKATHIQREVLEEWYVPVAATMLFEPICDYERKKLCSIISEWYEAYRIRDDRGRRE